MSDEELVETINARLGILLSFENMTDEGFIATNQAIAQMIIARETLTAKQTKD